MQPHYHARSSGKPAACFPALALCEPAPSGMDGQISRLGKTSPTRMARYTLIIGNIAMRGQPFLILTVPGDGVAHDLQE